MMMKVSVGMLNPFKAQCRIRDRVVGEREDETDVSIMVGGF